MCRITTSKKVLRCGYAVLVATGLWALISMGILAFECDMPTPWVLIPLSRCRPIWHIWRGSGIVNGLIELCLSKMAVFLVWNVKMPRKDKIKILMCFGMRLLILIPSVARLKYLYFAVYGSDFTYDRTDVNVLSQVTMHISIILATVPCAKPFFSVLEGGIFRTPHTSGSANTFNHSRVSSSTTTASRTIGVDGSRIPVVQPVRPRPQRAIPITWNHRDTWAKPFRKPTDSLHPDPALKSQHSRLNPFGWNRRVTFHVAKEPSSSSGIPLQDLDSPRNSSSRSRETSPRNRSPRSSRYTPLAKLPRAALPRLRSRDSSTYTSPPETPSSASRRRRRQSSADFWLGLGNEDAQTITTIRHDPEDADSRERKRKARIAEDKDHASRVEHTQSFQIASEEEEREEEDSISAAEQTRRRRQEAEELRRRGKFGIEQTQSFHVSYDAMPPNWGCCGAHGVDGSPERGP
ncbi:hypothetical protein DOTSEDRAFT_55637 [Dothistroma septosporum NZE10]|uniref:Rhodopsin domain-containing protein n=1 Tax=Dothistroma septosporum (strain NZE10 / CBS 128990) TaxID=675120 RepID=N1PE75_DOTSN|nr:hypothetical protein DOTSEDRAFT_55637 [Dothistroma septosporum NZE10]